jgi:hypothetical protein
MSGNATNRELTREAKLSRLNPSSLLHSLVSRFEFGFEVSSLFHRRTYPRKSISKHFCQEAAQPFEILRYILWLWDWDSPSFQLKIQGLKAETCQWCQLWHVPLTRRKPRSSASAPRCYSHHLRFLHWQTSGKRLGFNGSYSCIGLHILGIAFVKRLGSSFGK